MALMGADMLLYPTAIGSEPQDASIDSSGHWQRTMQGHAAANIMPLIASNRIGTEKGEKYTMTFYGSSFIASHTGEKVAEADRTSETVLTAAFDLEEHAPLPAILGRVPRSAARSVLSAAVARWPRLRICRRTWYSSIWRRPGGNAVHDRITEVGSGARQRTASSMEEWSSLVNPDRPIPPYIEAFTGISNAMVAGAPRFAEIAAAVRDKLKGAVFVAHNARFDYSFLRREFSEADIDFSAQVLCTVKLSRRLFPEFVRHNLDAVMERNGLSCSARHRALGDAKVIHDFWFKLRREVPQPQLARRCKRCWAPTSCRRTCRRAWPTNCPRGRACTASSAKRMCCCTSAGAIRCVPGSAAILQPKAASRMTAHWEAGCGGWIGWRPRGSWGRCCARRSG